MTTTISSEHAAPEVNQREPGLRSTELAVGQTLQVGGGIVPIARSSMRFDMPMISSDLHLRLTISTA